MSNPVLSSLLPVVLLIAIGFAAARAGWVRPAATKDLSNLVFMVLTPALLFRTMSSVQAQQLQFGPVAIYFVAVALLFAAVFLARSATREAAVLALAATFSNTVMIGIPLVGLAYGQSGLVTLFTLISVHALILLTAATLVLELLARAPDDAVQAPAQTWAAGVTTALLALKNGLIHPVPLPILLGLLYAQTGWGLPEVVDRPLHLLGQAFGPIALVLVGATLTTVRPGSRLSQALWVSALKNLALPALVALVGTVAGLQGQPLAVMVVAASLPTGANVFLFAQRYDVAEETVTATLALSTALGMVTISLVMAALAGLPAAA